MRKIERNFIHLIFFLDCHTTLCSSFPGQQIAQCECNVLLYITADVEMRCRNQGLAFSLSLTFLLNSDTLFLFHLKKCSIESHVSVVITAALLCLPSSPSCVKDFTI